MPASRSGLRTARDWKTKASISMPPPATSQAAMAPKGPVAAPNRAGSEKIPAPTMDPTTMAVRVPRENFSVDSMRYSPFYWLSGVAFWGALITPAG